MESYKLGRADAPQFEPHARRYLVKMKSIIHAILNSDLSAVRKIISADPASAWMKADSGDTPIQVAFAAGNYPICAALLKNSPQSIDEIPFTVPKLLEELIRYFSQSTLCSSWNQNIEYDLWALLIEDDEYKRDYDEYLNVNPETLSDVRWLASWAEGWFHWPNTENEPKFISMDKWVREYQKQKSKR